MPSYMLLDAPHQAGAQRMRTQKLIVKYAMCVANLDFNKSLASLQATVDDFHQVHQGLIFGSDDLFLPPATNPYVGFLVFFDKAMGPVNMFSHIKSVPLFCFNATDKELAQIMDIDLQ